MCGDEAERARPLEAEARIVGGDAFDHDRRLCCFFGSAERVPDQPRAYTDALAVRPNRHRREIEDPCARSALNADPAQHHVRDHTGRVLGDQRQFRNELFRRPKALDERRHLVGVPDECRADHLCDRGLVCVALGTDDDVLGHRPVRLTDLSRLAVQLDGVSERRRDGLLDWRYRGRLVARQLDDSHVVIRASFEFRDLLLQSFPETFSVPERFAKHMMIVADLVSGNPDAIEDAVISAWEMQSGH
jgi:hypothetical protein